MLKREANKLTETVGYCLYMEDSGSILLIVTIDIPKNIDAGLCAI